MVYSYLAYFLKARIWELDKLPLLDNGRVTLRNELIVGNVVLYAVRAEPTRGH
jgi:hypothetical protein